MPGYKDYMALGGVLAAIGQTGQEYVRGENERKREERRTAWETQRLQMQRDADEARLQMQQIFQRELAGTQHENSLELEGLRSQNQMALAEKQGGNAQRLAEINKQPIETAADVRVKEARAAVDEATAGAIAGGHYPTRGGAGAAARPQVMYEKNADGESVPVGVIGPDGKPQWFENRRAGAPAVPLAQAHKMAEAEADDMAGYLSTDGKDFKKWGGSRERFINERAQEIMHGGTPAGGSTSGAGVLDLLHSSGQRDVVRDLGLMGGRTTIADPNLKAARDALIKGGNEAKIRLKLLNAGYSEDQIDKALGQ